MGKTGEITVTVKLGKMHQAFLILRTRIIWLLKQLLPLTYRTHYGKDGKEMFCVWRMWFGKCFDIEEYAIGEYEA